MLQNTIFLFAAKSIKYIINYVTNTLFTGFPENVVQVDFLVVVKINNSKRKFV